MKKDKNKLSIKNIFSRNVPGTTACLSKITIGIAGCGGLGSNAAVALVRAGVGKLIISDFDIVEESNLNRQYYFIKDIGKKKVNALKAHLVSINPNLKIETHHTKLNKTNVVTIFQSTDLLIEAFDAAKSKEWLIETWCNKFPQKPLVCASGLGGVGHTCALMAKEMGKNLFICGDEISDARKGLCAARVAIVANMEANVAIEILLKKHQKAG